jgi:hypothetical protein
MLDGSTIRSADQMSLLSENAPRDVGVDVPPPELGG